jgi:uncharacterized protein (DUF2235 family)
MKRITICFDGTWNKPADENLPDAQQVETNVRRFYEALAPQDANGIAQPKWYDQGVGTHWYDKFAGGTLGVGLEENIRQGYSFLAKNYDEGDEVYIVGFSRGAYTARSLVGMIRNIGLIKKSRVNAARVLMGYGIYRTRDDGPDSVVAKAFRAINAREIKIKFVGVWDTVGALGIPLNMLNAVNQQFYQFHDTRLSGIVEQAYQAVAVDEHRQHYDVCLWTPTEKPAQTIEQRWFPGAHSDVGGGYATRQLSDLALKWMLIKAAGAGLAISDHHWPGIDDDNCLGPITNSYAQFMGGKYAKLNGPFVRKVKQSQFGNEEVDEAVTQRRARLPEYQPQNIGL